MADEVEVDGHLVAVLNQVLDAVYQAKQAAWSASTSPVRADLQELVSFLIDQSGRFMVAEERIGGRSADVASPSAHNRGNLLADAHDDHTKAVVLLTQRLNALADDVRARSAAIPDAAEASMFAELAEGLDAHIRRLRAS